MEWKEVPNYEGLYDLRSDGLIHCYPRKGTKEKYTYGYITGGYLHFDLRKNKTRETKGVHCIVYETFVGEIPEGYDVHHINGDKTDNRVENLELIIHSKHCKKHLEKHREKTVSAAIKITSKPVLQYTLEGQFVAEYPSIAEAERQTGCRHISMVCNGKYKQSGGYVWQFVA